MKRVFSLLTGCLALFAAACDSGEDSVGGSEWFLIPECTVYGTSVTVHCDTKFGDGVLNASNAGIAYAEVIGTGLGEFVSAQEVTVSGSRISATLDGLQPETQYTVCAYADLGAGRMQSIGSLFRTGKQSAQPDPDDPDPDPGQDPDPDPDPDPTPVGPTKFAGWPELPVEVADPDLYYAYHICPDFRVDGHLARNYTVCYSAEHHCPVWVSAPLHESYVGTNGNRNYGPDPDIPYSIQPSSKSVNEPYNKGHMLGNRERSKTSGMNKQVSYYTNMAPQHMTTFNTGGGAWNNLENRIDGYLCEDTLYMTSGCLFDTWTDTYGHTATPKRIGFGGVQASVPTAFYYVLLRTKGGATGKSVLECSADELQCVGFVISHAMPKGHEPQREDMRKVSEIEKMTGFTFFANVPNAPKDTCDPSDWGL